jgi:hypothetical protein
MLRFEHGDRRDDHATPHANLHQPLMLQPPIRQESSAVQTRVIPVRLRSLHDPRFAARRGSKMYLIMTCEISVRVCGHSFVHSGVIAKPGKENCETVCR